MLLQGKILCIVSALRHEQNKPVRLILLATSSAGYSTEGGETLTLCHRRGMGKTLFNLGGVQEASQMSAQQGRGRLAHIQGVLLRLEAILRIVDVAALKQ